MGNALEILEGVLRDAPTRSNRLLFIGAVFPCDTNGREPSLGARGVRLGYGEGEEVALAVAL